MPNRSKLCGKDNSRRIDLDVNLLKSVLVLGAVVEARDAYTGGHNWRVAQYSKLLARQAGLSSSAIFFAGLGGFLHDLGKVAIPDMILNKSADLTILEFNLMKTHPATGHALVAEHPLGPLFLDAVAHHHERIDGQGYPYHLAGQSLSLIPRIVGIADSFDAMTSTRPYRKAMQKDQALKILSEERGRQFDELLVNHFFAIDDTDRLNHIIGHSDEGRPLGVCPVDGPIMAIPRSKNDGDIVQCNACKGLFRLHVKKDTFELEHLVEKRFDIQPEVDSEMIIEFARSAPSRLEVAEDLTYSG